MIAALARNDRARRRQFGCLYSAGAPNPLMGFGDSFPDECAFGELPPNRTFVRQIACFATRVRRPFSVLKGLMPGSSGRNRASPGVSSLSEVLHRP